MFPTLDEKMSLQQLVILYKGIYGDDVKSVETECKRAIIRVATFQGIIRATDSNARDKK